MRQTDLSIEELKNHFNGTNPLFYWHCMLVNEVGTIARLGNSDSPEAQKILVGLLSSEEESDRYIAIRFLMDMKVTGIATQETLESITSFEDNPDNANVLPWPGELESIRARAEVTVN